MKKLFVLLLALVVFGAIGYSFAYYNNENTFTTKVRDKERVTTSDSDGHIKSFYLVYTDNGTYSLKDELLYGNFRSSDLYGKIVRDSTYEITTVGFRVGFLSMYPNIVKIK